MQQWKKGLASVLVLLGIAVLPAFADEKKGHWEYGERKGYGAPPISATDARKAVQESQATWRVGAVYQKREEDGLELVVLIHNDAGRVAKLAVDPETGEILPHALDAYGRDMKLSQEEIVQQVAAILPKLQVGERAWLGEHGRYWRIPLFLDGTLVSTVKVDARSGKLRVDQPEETEDEDD
jgi:hypothetical protein